MKICFFGVHQWTYKIMISQGDKMVSEVRICKLCNKRQNKLQNQWHTYSNAGAPIVIFPATWGIRYGLN